MEMGGVGYRLLLVVISVALALSGGRGTRPRLRWSLGLWLCPVPGLLLRETLEHRQTATGVKWRWIIKTDKGPEEGQRMGEGRGGEAGWR